MIQRWLLPNMPFGAEMIADFNNAMRVAEAGTLVVCPYTNIAYLGV